MSLLTITRGPYDGDDGLTTWLYDVTAGDGSTGILAVSGGIEFGAGEVVDAPVAPTNEPSEY